MSKGFSFGCFFRVAAQRGIHLLYTLLILACLTTACSSDNDGANTTVAPLIPPPAPQSVRATPTPNFDDEGTSVNISWPWTYGTYSGIVIERRGFAGSPLTVSQAWPSEQGVWREIGDLPSNTVSYSDDDTQCGMNYEYRVCNVGSDGTRSCSAPVRVHSCLCPPKDLTATFVPPMAVSLNWRDTSTGETGFAIYRKTAPSGPFQQIALAPANATTYMDYSVVCNTHYIYKVQAVGESGNSSFSNAANVETIECPPEAPSVLSATATSASEIRLAWTDNSVNEEGFRIERGSGPEGPFEEIEMTEADVTGYSDTGLNQLTTYYYRVRAFGGGGNSGYSNVASATTLGPCNDGLDNDGDGLIDWPDDPGCSSASDAGELGTNQCDDGIDNDGDGLIDWPNDPNCQSIADTNESNIWYVDIDARGANTGLSWKDAFLHPQDATNAAAAGDAIWTAEGTYQRQVGGTGPVLTQKEGVEIYGGFAGTEINFAQRGDPAAHPTILDGENTSFHVVIGASDSRLDGLTITRGNAINDGTCKANYTNNNCNGGGIYNAYVNRMVIANCIIEENKAGHRGAAIENYFSSPTISNVVFKANSAVYWNGGAIYNWTSSPVITDCQFLNNTAGDHGGAMDSYLNSYPVIIRCVFDGNYAVAYGGALNNWTSTYATVINSLFLRNQTNDLGGAMYNYRNTISITNCTFSGNSSKNQGGALYNNMATSVVIKNSILWGDTSGDGREITNSSSSPTITYSDIQGGYAGTGNLNLSPLFVEYPDVHLQSGSPCVDTGAATDAPGDDLDGNPRPSGLGYDMGAYEYLY